ncbi:hypothetical protein DVH24_010122, partial [Malus domestica]
YGTEVQGRRGRGRPRKTLEETLRKDLILDLTEDMTQNRAQWRSRIHIADPTYFHECVIHFLVIAHCCGWQPGIQEGAADWDEDWDKFEDEGFTCVKELTLDVSNVLAPPKQKSSSVQKEKAPQVESPTTASSLKVDVKSEKPQSTDAKVVENGAAYDKNEDESAKSAPNSPFASSTVGSPSREFSDSNYGKTTDADASPHNKESQSHDHAGAGSMFSGDKGSDEPAWGTFDNNDDVDSVWGFNAVSTTKDMDQESNKDHYFSGPGEFGLNPIRTGSSQGGGFSQKSRPFTFDDSVPSTPLSAFNSGYSPPRYKDSSEPSFDTFSRFDSFRSTQDTGFFPQPEALGRFDSMRSSRDFDQGNGFPTFDDIPDPFGSSAPFRSSLDSQTPRRDSDPFGSSGPFRTSLDSQTPRKESDFFGSSAAPFRTSFDSQTSRGDSDAFGSSPFRTSFEGQTPRRDSDPFVYSGPFRTSLETPRKDSDHWTVPCKLRDTKCSIRFKISGKCSSSEHHSRLSFLRYFNFQMLIGRLRRLLQRANDSSETFSLHLFLGSFSRCPH